MSGTFDDDWYADHVLYFREPGGESVLIGPAAEWEAWWRVNARDLARDQPHLSTACRQGFVLRTDQLADAGVTRKRARTLVKRGTWSAPETGTVAVLDPSLGDPTPSRWTIERRRHALACAAATLRNPGFVVGGASGAILHGLPTTNIPPRPQLTAPLRRNAHRRGKATIRPGDVADWFGIPVFSVARTVVDVARRDRRDGVTVADAALREKLVEPGDLQRVLEAQRGWCGVRSAREIVAFADAHAESPLESLTRLALHDDGFPPPRLQVPFAVPGRRMPYRVDLCWPEFGVILECDGRLKYREDRNWKDKRRDLALRRASGYQIERVVWPDVVRNWPATSECLWAVLGLAAR